MPEACRGCIGPGGEWKPCGNVACPLLPKITSRVIHNLGGIMPHKKPE